MSSDKAILIVLGLRKVAKYSGVFVKSVTVVLFKLGQTSQKASDILQNGRVLSPRKASCRNMFGMFASLD